MRVGRFSSGQVLCVAVVVVGAISPAAFAQSPKGAGGVGIVSVRALPASVQQHGGRGGPLSAKALNVVTATVGLGFSIRVRNDSAVLKRDVSATLTISRAVFKGGPLTTTVKVGTLGPHSSRTLTVPASGQVPFASRTELVVRVTGAGARVYPIIFSLPSGNGAGSGVRPVATALTVPSLVGLPEEQAVERLQATGMDVLLVQVFSPEPRGDVVQQSPGPGSRLTRGSVVKLDVSEGPKQP